MIFLRTWISKIFLL